MKTYHALISCIGNRCWTRRSLWKLHICEWFLLINSIVCTVGIWEWISDLTLYYGCHYLSTMGLKSVKWAPIGKCRQPRDTDPPRACMGDISNHSPAGYWHNRIPTGNHNPFDKWLSLNCISSYNKSLSVLCNYLSDAIPLVFFVNSFLFY